MATTASQRAANKRWRDKNRHRPSKRGWINKRDGLEMVVYVIETGDYIKVGIAEDIKSRLVVFKSHCPMPVRLAYCSTPMLRPQAREIEVACHTHLIAFHEHGEWFKAPVDAALAFLRGLASEPVSAPPLQLRLIK